MLKENTLDVVMLGVITEVEEQNKKWGDQKHHPVLWLSILMEEVGEAAKAVNEDSWEEVYKELIQVAAVAISSANGLKRSSSPVSTWTLDEGFSGYLMEPEL